MTNRVLVVGQGKLFDEMVFFLEECGGIVTTLSDFVPANEIVAVIDVETGIDDEKKSGLHQVEQRITNQTPIFTSVLHRTATEIASWMFYPERVIGFSPLLMKRNILEICYPIQVKRPNRKHLQLWEGVGKEIEVVGDQPGLVFARTLALIVNEAAFALSEGVAQAADIDLAMKKGVNHPFGPLEWADQLGIDHLYAVLTGLQREYGEDRYRPAPLLKKMIYANWIGKETEQGFYSYGPDGVRRDLYSFADREQTLRSHHTLMKS